MTDIDMALIAGSVFGFIIAVSLIASVRIVLNWLKR